MAGISPSNREAIEAACLRGAAEAAEAWGRALDAPGIVVQPGQPEPFDSQRLPSGCEGPGLLLVLGVGAQAVLVAVPAGDGLLPSWCQAPDATGVSKLTTLAQELGMILLPEDLAPESFDSRWVPRLADALLQSGLTTEGAQLPLKLAHQGRTGMAWLLWPTAAGEGDSTQSRDSDATATPNPAATAQGTRPVGRPSTPPKPAPPQPRLTPDQLPIYSKSLLRIKVPLVVTLARKRQPLGRIVELGPGSIIQFDKSCEEMLDLEIGDCRVASGEAVKVGEKFGLRITSMILPGERFHKLKPPEGFTAPAARHG